MEEVKIKGGYSDLWQGIIRPARDIYKPYELGINSSSLR